VSTPQDVIVSKFYENDKDENGSNKLIVGRSFLDETR